MAPLLSVTGLTVEFAPRRGPWLPVIDNVSFEINRNEVLALVGESGSGKTVTSLALLGLVEYRGGRIASGSVEFDGIQLRDLTARGWRGIRGNRIGMIFQEPTEALNPAFTVGDQISETVRVHSTATRRSARNRAIELMRLVRIPNPEQRVRDYPHMFSGGMCQRVAIAQALAAEPDLLIADEPTTALDLTVQARILQLLRDIQERTGISILLITHDFGVVSEMADSVVVMYAGQVVETGPASDVLTHPIHPYTETLLGAVHASGQDGRVATAPGIVPGPNEIPPGCRFHPRCVHAIADCETVAVELREFGVRRMSRCLRSHELYF